MSRIAKAPVELPAGVTATIAADAVTIKGAKGSLSLPLTTGVSVVQTDKKLQIRFDAEGLARMRAGATRAHLANMVRGVTRGYEKKLELVGVGFRAQVQGKSLNLTLGFSHPVNVPIPEGINIETPSQTEIVVKGIDRQKVGQVAAEIRDIRPPEPYKGKGVRYAGEQITLKEGPAARRQDARAHPRFGRGAPHRAPHSAAHLRAGRGRRGREGARRRLHRSGGFARRPEGHRQRRGRQGGRACHRRAGQGGGSEPGRLRPLRVSFPWARQGARRCGPRGGPRVLGR